ncbi:hypothetical protein ABK040_002009 [Willaertia magna]
MQVLPFEIIEIIFSFMFNTFNLHSNIYPIRYLNKHYFEFTQQERFWNVLLIENQRLNNNCNFHQWFYTILQKRIDTVKNILWSNKENKEIEETMCEIFQQYVNKWIDMLSNEKDYKNCNLLLNFLLKISFSQNTLEYITPKNMISCFHYLFYKLLEPTLNIINTLPLKQENNFNKTDLFNLSILQFLQNLNQEDQLNNILNNWYYPYCQSYWRVIDSSYSIFPRDLLLIIVNKLSNVKMNNEDIACFIVKELYQKCGLFIFLFDFKEEKNFISKDCYLKPLFCNEFLLQHFACWKENEELLQFCLNPNKKIKQIDEVLNNLNNNEENKFNEERTLKEEMDGIVSMFTMSNLSDNIGLTVLHYAVKQENLSLIKLLILNYNANPFHRSNYHYISPIELSILLKKDNVLNLFKELIGEQFINLHLKNTNVMKEKERNDCEKILQQESEMNRFTLRSNPFQEYIEERKNLVDLDNVENDDIQEIIKDKEIKCFSNRDMERQPMRSNFTMEITYASALDDDNYYNKEPSDIGYFRYSDDDEDEEIISLPKVLNSSSNNNRTVSGSERSYVCALENCNAIKNIELNITKEMNDINQIQNVLKPYETVNCGDYNYYYYQSDKVKVKVGKRKLRDDYYESYEYDSDYSDDDDGDNKTSQIVIKEEDEEDVYNTNEKPPSEKKVKMALNNNENIYNQNNQDYKVEEIDLNNPIIKRKHLLFPKNSFRNFIHMTTNDYKSDVAFTPMAFNILQDALEKLTSDSIFTIANSLLNFYNLEYLDEKELEIVNQLFDKKQLFYYESFTMNENLIEYIFWKLNNTDLFSKMNDVLNKIDNDVTKLDDNYHFEFEKNNHELNSLLLRMDYEINNVLNFERDNDEINNTDYNVEEKEMEEHVFNEDGYSTDSNLSTIVLYQANSKYYSEMGVQYLCDSKEKERRISERLYHFKKKDEEYDSSNSEEDNYEYYIENIKNTYNDKLVYTNSRQVAIDWLNNANKDEFLEKEYLSKF